MTDQHDARDETAELLAWFTEADGFNQGTKAPHKWVLRAEQELRRRAATQPTKPEQQAGGVPAGWQPASGMTLPTRILQIAWFLTVAVGLPALTIVTDAHWLARNASFVISGMFWGIAPGALCFRRNP